MSNQRNTNDQGDQENDFDSILSSDQPLDMVYQIYKSKNMSDKEIDAFVDKLRTAREKIKKSVRKFLGKINATYGHLDIPELMKKGMKHAAKYGLNDVETRVFLKYVMKGDVHNLYSYDNELRYSPMAKFLGFDAVYGQLIKIQAKDQAKLNELSAIYEETKQIHTDVKTQMFNYRDCAPEAINGTYDRNKHNVGVSIHPVLIALFTPKIEHIEKRMLYTNIARLVLSRAQAYLKNYNFHAQTNVAPGEIDAEFDLAYDIAHDPNSLEYFKDDAPVDNMIKRYRCQVELYQSVLNLRQGRYYSTGYGENDGITGFLRIINSYDWTFYDSPELFHVQDEGTVLRKLLAVFSLRPTFTQLSTISERMGLGQTSLTNLAQTVFVNIPIVNVKLPIDPIENRPTTMSLSKALAQTDYFIEHKILVPKNKSVIYSNGVIFFYAVRRYPSVNINNFNMSMRCMSLPLAFVNQTTINKTLLDYPQPLRIGKSFFDLRSVVVLQRPPINGVEIAGSCSTLISVGVNTPQSPIFQGFGDSFLYYNPSVAAIQYSDEEFQVKGQSQYVSNTPFTFIKEIDGRPGKIGFRTEAMERGTIFFYAKQPMMGARCM